MTEGVADPAGGARTSRVRLVLVNLCILLALLVAAEGLSSYVLFINRLMTTAPVAERVHAEYDAELGWVNRKNVSFPDMYGPGISLRTNGQRFRGDHDYTSAVPSGKTRVVCSGDSFTLGFGVDDRHTWCGLLASIDPSIEAVNMGQGGYGVDQAYLWYKRDGLQIQHHVHILAMISDDFRRMQSDSLAGYGKPVLEVENGALVVRNVPVPRRTSMVQGLVDLGVRAEQLKTVELGRRLFARLGMTNGDASGSNQDVRNRKTRLVMRKILEELATLHREQGRQLFVMYLPMLEELTGDRVDAWLPFVKAESKALGVPVIDVVDAFRGLAPAEVSEMFIADGPSVYPGAQGHLSNQGNGRVAEIVLQAMHGRPR